VTRRNKLRRLTNFDFPNERNRRDGLGIDRDAQEDRRGQRVFRGWIWESLLRTPAVPQPDRLHLGADAHLPAAVRGPAHRVRPHPRHRPDLPQAQEWQNNSNHQRDDLYALQLQNDFKWYVSDRRFGGDHAVQIKDNFYGEQDIRRRAARATRSSNTTATCSTPRPPTSPTTPRWSPTATAGPSSSTAPSSTPRP
jgi:hypothetical protein